MLMWGGNHKRRLQDFGWPDFMVILKVISLGSQQLQLFLHILYLKVCEYKIEHESVTEQSPEPYPPCSSLTWGPGSAFFRYGLTTYQQSSTIYTREGKAELQVFSTI